MPLERSCGFVIAYRKGPEDLYLLVRQHTHWSFPKGHIEKGETPLEAARRELFEETGLRDITVLQGCEFIEEYVFERDGIATQKVNTYFLATISTTEGVRAQAGEISECKFATLQEAGTILAYAESKQTLASAAKELESIPRV